MTKTSTLALRLRAFARCLPLLTIGAFAGPAAAAEPDARDLYEQGAAAYREGRYDDAASLLARAEQLEPHAELAFDLGRAYEAGGKLELALSAFRDYLRQDPGAQDRVGVEARIRSLEERLTAERQPRRGAITEPPPVSAAAPATPPPEGRPPDATPARKVSLPTWITLGVGVGALGAAVGFDVVRRTEERAAADASTQVDHETHYQSAAQRRDVARVFVGVGAAAVLAGGALLYWDLRERPGTPAAAARRGPLVGLGAVGAGFGVACRGEF